MRDECRTQLVSAASVLLQKLDMLEKGSICIKDMDLISQNFDMFKKLLTTMLNKDGTPKLETYFDSLLNIRRMEIDAFQGVLQHVKGFLDLCSSINGELIIMFQIQLI